MKLTYDDMKLPFYVNSNVAAKVRIEDEGEMKTMDLSLSDMVFAAELAGLNMLYIADAGGGKSQLMSDIAWSHFGGTGAAGNALLMMGRLDFDVREVLVRTTVDLAKGYDSRDTSIVDPDKRRRRIFGFDELNRMPEARQSDCMDFMNGQYFFQGSAVPLGTDGYTLFIATCNMNKMNGDHSGTFPMTRALLSRAHLTIDFDHSAFRETVDDEIAMEQMKGGPKVKVPDEPKDISDKIIEVHKEIIESAGRLDPYLLAFRFLIGKGLKYCSSDAYKEKNETFPMLCPECSSTGKDLCSRLKGSSNRTVSAVKMLANAIDYVVRMKLGKDVKTNMMDAALQAFRFTTYHGNLNPVMAREEYAERRQIMMDETVERLKKGVDLVGEYIECITEGNGTELIRYSLPEGEDYKTSRDPRMEESLRQNKIPYRITRLEDELKDVGIGSEWVEGYAKHFRK
jgi:hypothetical protein